MCIRDSHDTARLLEAHCEPGVDFAGHVSGSRFVILMQSDDWRERAERLVAAFPAVRDAHMPPEVRERGYFTVRRRDGRDYVRPPPKLVVGILPVLPGVFESRHEVVAVAKRAAEKAQSQPRDALLLAVHREGRSALTRVEVEEAREKTAGTHQLRHAPTPIRPQPPGQRAEESPFVHH